MSEIVILTDQRSDHNHEDKNVAERARRWGDITIGEMVSDRTFVRLEESIREKVRKAYIAGYEDGGASIVNTRKET